MIKSKLIATKKEPPTKPFPKLMANEMVIAMFASQSQATVVYEKKPSSLSVGTIIDVSNFNSFTDFYGTVEISNS